MLEIGFGLIYVTIFAYVLYRDIKVLNILKNINANDLRFGNFKNLSTIWKFSLWFDLLTLVIIAFIVYNNSQTNTITWYAWFAIFTLTIGSSLNLLHVLMVNIKLKLKRE